MIQGKISRQERLILANSKGEIEAMTDAARWNLQHGIEEDKRFEHTTYNVESPLDALVLARVRNRRLLLDEANYNKFVDAAGKEIAAAAEKEIDKLLKDFK